MENYKVVGTDSEHFLMFAACICYLRPCDVSPLTEELGLVVGNNLVYHNDWKASLSEEEAAAILAHEEGHVYYNHMARMAEEMDDAPVKETVVSMNQEWEYEADAYAAQKCGAAICIAALKKTAEWIIDGMNLSEEDREDESKALYKSIEIRFERLEALL